MNYDEAAEVHKAQWQLGKAEGDYVFPYDIRYKGDEFIATIVPCVTCKLQAVDVGRVNKYIDLMVSGVEMGPGWVAYGKRLQDGSVARFEHKMLYVLDGNHRITSRKTLGKFYTEVIMPKSNFTLYVRDYK